MTQVQVGDAVGASQRLAKALKLAHTGLQNHHLVTQVLQCIQFCMLQQSIPHSSRAMSLTHVTMACKISRA